MKTYRLETQQEVRATVLVTLTVQADSPEEALSKFRDWRNDEVIRDEALESINDIMYDSLDDYGALSQIEEIL